MGGKSGDKSGSGEARVEGVLGGVCVKLEGV